MSDIHLPNRGGKKLSAFSQILNLSKSLEVLEYLQMVFYNSLQIK